MPTNDRQLARAEDVLRQVAGGVCEFKTGAEKRSLKKAAIFILEHLAQVEKENRDADEAQRDQGRKSAHPVVPHQVGAFLYVPSPTGPRQVTVLMQGVAYADHGAITMIGYDQIGKTVFLSAGDEWWGESAK